MLGNGLKMRGDIYDGQTLLVNFYMDGDTPFTGTPLYQTKG